MTLLKSKINLSLFGWLTYDFANTIFSMNILTMYFAQWIIVDLGCPDIYYSMAYSISMIAVALTLPYFGLRSDRFGNKKAYLVAFTLASIVFTFVLGIAVYLTVDIALLLVIGLLCVALANYFFEGGLVFYNALLPSVSDKKNVGTISGLGVGIGYVGAIVGLLLVQPLVNGAISFLPAGRKAAFLPTAILFFIFFLPTWAFLKEKHNQVVSKSVAADRCGIKQLWDDLREASKYKGAFRFLIADYFFEDAIATLILFMAVYVQKVMGLPDEVKIAFFLVSTVSAVVGSFISGRLSDHFGYFKTLKWVILCWIALLACVSVVTSEALFWVMGSMIGILLGSTWSISRPLLNSLVPEHKLGFFYGLYSLSGRVAAIAGPIVWGAVVLWCTSGSAPVRFIVSILESVGISISDKVLGTIEYRIALFSLALVMLIGLVIYRKIPDRFREKEAISPSGSS